MSLQISTICESISQLQVNGVRIMPLDEIPVNVEQRMPTIFPAPDGLVTDFTLEMDSYGSGDTAKMHVTYTIHYRLCHSPIGSDRVFAGYTDMVDTAFRFLDAVITSGTLDGAENWSVAPINFGPTADPSGAMFHGCEFEITVMEFVN